jgi:hypothetical protein
LTGHLTTALAFGRSPSAAWAHASASCSAEPSGHSPHCASSASRLTRAKRELIASSTVPSPATRARPEFVRLSTASVTEANSAPLSASSWRVMNRPRIEWSGVIPPHTHMHSRSLRVSRSSPRSELIPLIRPNSTTPAISHGAYPRRPTGLYCPSNALQSCSLRISRSTRASRSPISRRCASRRCIPMRISRGSGSSKRIPPRGASTCTNPHPGSLSNSSKPSCVPVLIRVTRRLIFFCSMAPPISSTPARILAQRRGEGFATPSSVAHRASITGRPLI